MWQAKHLLLTAKRTKRSTTKLIHLVMFCAQASFGMYVLWWVMIVEINSNAHGTPG